jgi:ligand-binding SRPBCC domain-containing protein
MSFYQLRTQLKIHAPIEAVWKFISSPQNLRQITPDHMDFQITSEELPERIYEGMIIKYNVRPLLGIRTNWVTEITHIREGQYFVDEQRVGPYRMWHHQHIIEPDGKDTIMKDIVSYQPPLGIFGALINRFVIQKELDKIFEYRTKSLNSIFDEKA